LDLDHSFLVLTFTKKLSELKRSSSSYCENCIDEKVFSLCAEAMPWCESKFYRVEWRQLYGQENRHGNPIDLLQKIQFPENFSLGLAAEKKKGLQ
jgi:hypothetical protein